MVGRPRNTTRDSNAATWRLLALLTVSLYLPWWTGCSSTGKPADGGFAAVDINGNTPGQIHDAAVEVFQKNGYQVTNKDLEAMVFEKEGTKWDNLAYGNWEEDTPVWVRVKASIVSISEARFRLKCNAYFVRGHSSVLEEEVACLRSAPYQKLMAEVAARLRGEVQPVAKH
jgi:hypothetical protein